jgi:hypothetical protein
MSIEAMKQALDYMQSDLAGRIKKKPHAIASLRQAIEQAEKQGPVAWLAPRYEGGHENLAVADQNEFGAFPVYTTPQPQREQVVFPTMLRKMWSGGEVQVWLDENVNKEKNT